MRNSTERGYDVDVNAKVQDLLETQIGEGRQTGVQVCAHVHGECVIDVVAGTMGSDDPRPVQPDTLFLTFSATKGPTALLIHQLADRGLLDYDTPVAEYWPAFGQHGKDRLTVAQVMSHQAGLHALPKPFDISSITDWDAGIARIENGIPAWEPGTATGYHAVTFGFIAGGIVKAITGRHIKDLFQTEIAEPLGVQDEFFVGLPADGSVDNRLATVDVVDLPEEIPEDSMFFESTPRGLLMHVHGKPFKEACLPAGNGHFSARALSRMYGALANNGTIDGVTLVSPERISEMQRLQTDDLDLVTQMPFRKNIGFFAGGELPDLEGNLVHGPMGARHTAFGHAGYGGSDGFADPDIGLGMAVTVNQTALDAPGTGTTLEICDLVRTLI
jgi:CubicO group peptidase (beta-lactamase class C family)